MIDRALIDTSALLALANPRDRNHKRAVAAVRRLVDSGCRLIGTTLILAEFHSHMTRLARARAHIVLNALLEDPLYEWRETPAQLVSEASHAWLLRHGVQAFSLTDAVSFELMRQEKIDTAFAYWEGFRVAGFGMEG
ncbi:MAG: hypothetical protein O7D29_03410 [Gemmatimonadetes bacterium]|nr:hypothetical protein [Gemmatimonadota bacterium]